MLGDTKVHCDIYLIAESQTEGDASETRDVDAQISDATEHDRDWIITYSSDCWNRLPVTCRTREKGIEALDIASRQEFVVGSNKPSTEGWESLWAQYPPTFFDIMVDLLGASNKRCLILHDTISKATEAPIEGESDAVSA
jgi:hypothetical protein